MMGIGKGGRMSIGAGILYSTIAILLFAAFWLITSRRGWKTVGKVTAFVVGLILIVTIGFWGWDGYSKRAVRLDALDGVRVGMTRGDVQVEKGEPGQTSEVSDDNLLALTYTKSYSSERLMVGIDGSEIHSKVFRVCQFGGLRLFGLDDYSTEADVRKKFGTPDEEALADSGLSKRLTFEKYNLWTTIEAGKLAGVCVGLDQK